MKYDDIRTIKGVGEKTAKYLSKLGIETISDLREFYPYRYIKYPEISYIDTCKEDDTAAIKAIMLVIPHSYRIGKGMSVARAVIEDITGKLEAVWFNSPYIAKSLHTQTEYVFLGKITKNKSGYCIQHPIVYNINDYINLSGKLRPVYHLTRGISQKVIYKVIKSSLENYDEEDYLPNSIKEDYNLVSRDYALKKIHCPENDDELKKARRRLTFDEFFAFQYSIRKSRQYGDKNKYNYKFNTSGLLDEFKSYLPFKLTDSQTAAIKEIFNDLSSDKVMNRLLQGDVGSGKTVVAMAAMYAAYKNDCQSVLMVPTEVLSLQHFKTFTGFLKGKDCPEVILLTGSMTNSEKIKAYERIKTHEADIIIGTQAVFQKNTVYANLGLVITDEQHRFGVHQRHMLNAKGSFPHVLAMSATPIPRTLAVTMYGESDISTVVSKPSGRLPVKNTVISAKDRGKAYRSILNEINAGHQAYIICPSIEDNEFNDIENVIDYAGKLRKIMPENIRVAIMYGLLKQEDKDRIMSDFVRGSIDLLVSTTVIEVGVDVPNATIIMIENAERYGLASLHQLRGRVGRGEAQSYCIFVNTSDSEKSRERLKVVNESNDGFFIASEDLRLRGPGEILGLAQSGDLRFKLGDIYADSESLIAAGKLCRDLFERKFELTEDEYEKINIRLSKYQSKYLESIEL